ncbi:MAG TPA: hypothetical protein PKD09_13065 [Aggregatilinea sp.]|jgi:hypothetical protein|uniref:hypothetical protein n=1 Tax=Aggregatilinea sp. TaxID=2806333 RepID=UPI002C3DEB80|nr:hypothetical protein [Aggregatilinea sp.]HML22577.1 hypothetical protein [Aggregatilinea sp.]
MSIFNINQNAVFGPPLQDPQYQCDIFVIMPFDQSFTPIYENHLKSIADRLGYSIKRGDDFFSRHAIMADVWSAITNTKLIIADCTNRNPNVFYELGIAHTLDKPVIMITQNREDIPFDVGHLRIILYKFTLNGMAELERLLEDALEKVLNSAGENILEGLKEDPTSLPSDPDDQWEIVQSLINKGDFDTFAAILPFLKNVKLKTINKFIEMGDIPHATEVTHTLEASNSFKSVGKALYDAGYTDIPLMRETIDKTLNHSEKRALGRHILKNKGENSEVFRYLIRSFSNARELGNLALYFLEFDRANSPVLDEIIELLNTSERKAAVLVDLGMEFIKRDMITESQFKHILMALEEYQSHIEEFLRAWVKNYRQSAIDALNKGIISTPSSIKYVKNLLI